MAGIASAVVAAAAVFSNTHTMRLSKALYKCARGALVLVTTALTACGSANRNSSQASTPAPRVVTVITVEPDRIPITDSFTGRLSAYREANVLARVAGVLLKRLYEEGTEVRAGQPLFAIDSAPYRAALDGALAALAQARATAANAHINAQRDRDLISTHLVSEQQLDTDEATERSTAAVVKQAEANVESARINLGYTTVTSPISGIAGEQQVTEGALVGEGTPTLLTTVDQLDPIYVNFDEPATQIEQLTSLAQRGLISAVSGRQATLRLARPDGTPYGLPGALDFRAATVDPSSGAAALRGVVPNPGHSLLPGMYVHLRVTVGIASHAFLVPQLALQRDRRGSYVLSVEPDGTVALKRVKTEGASGTDWIVWSGLTAGEHIVVAGIQGALPGTKVTATERRATGGKSPAATDAAPAAGQ